MISGDTTVARLLDEHPALLDVLVEYHSHFKHLCNRLLRKVMAPRVTVNQAARIAGVPEEELLRVLRRALGEEEPHAHFPAAARPAEPFERASKPAFLEALPESRRVDLDVREVIRRGEEPFARIMTATDSPRIDVRGLEPPQPMVRVLELLDTLEPGQRLEVLHDRRPLFLYPQLDAQGFVHETEEVGPGLVRIIIRRRS